MTITTSGMTPLLQVYDMPQALAFYRDVLGFEIVAASAPVDTPEGHFSHWMCLGLGPARVMLNTAYDDGQCPPVRVDAQQRWHNDTCLYFGCDNVDAVYDVLKAHWPDLEPPIDAPYGMRQLYLSDPDGYSLCFQAPIPALRSARESL